MAGNNGLGINSFSGPMGEKEPAYGAVERASVLSKLAPVGSPQALNAPRRAKRAAVRGTKANRASKAAPPLDVGRASLPPPAPSHDMLSHEFWQQAATNPDASPLVQQLAASA